MDLVSILVLTVLVIFYGWLFYNIPIITVGLREVLRTRRKQQSAAASPDPYVAGALPFVSLVVPVKNEELVIGRLLRALSRLTYPAERFEVLVVEDGSTDRTQAICESYRPKIAGRLRLLHRTESSGKPAALNYGLAHAKGTIIGVFDADSVPEPACLLRAVQTFTDPSVAAVQGRTCSINAQENMLTSVLAYEETVRFDAHLQGKDALAMFIPLAGSCYFVRKRVLDQLHGWDAASLSEDMELSAKLTEHGYAIKYAPTVRAWQENPATLLQFFRQRTRWFRGCMEVALRYGRLLRRLNRQTLDAEVTLVGPFMSLPFIGGYLLGVFTLLGVIQPHPLCTLLAQGSTWLTTLTLLVLGITLVGVSQPRRLRNLLWVPFVYLYWSVQTFIAAYALLRILFKRPRLWQKTDKTGVTTQFALPLPSRLRFLEPVPPAEPDG